MAFQSNLNVTLNRIRLGTLIKRTINIIRRTQDNIYGSIGFWDDAMFTNNQRKQDLRFVYKQTENRILMLFT